MEKVVMSRGYSYNEETVAEQTYLAKGHENVTTTVRETSGEQ